MKKTLALLLTILLLTIAFVSCNLDGTTGIFREIAQSKAPLGIRYKQLLGINTDLYFRTAKGVERVTTAKVNTPVASSSYENIIQSAALYPSDNQLLYITNNDAEQTGNLVNAKDTTTLSNPKTTIAITTTQATDIKTDLAIVNLYANSMVLVTGKDASAMKVFQLLEYDGTNFNTPVASFTMTDNAYGLYAVIQQTAKEQVLNAEMIVSFVSIVDGVVARSHYLVNPSIVGPPTILGTENVAIANFFYIDTTNMYVLTTDGKIYHVDPTGPTWTLIGSSSKSYITNAFVLAVIDGTDYHIVTKPLSKTSPLRVFTIDTTNPLANIGAGVDVKTGYAKELALADIVSAQKKTTSTATVTDLLVATHEDGMYDITITHANANDDNNTNGSTSEAEDYTFI